MKKFFTVFILFSLPLAPVRAQGLHGRILIVRDSAYTFSDTIQSLLHKIYHGRVDTHQAVPTDLSPYDAVLLFPDISNYGSPDTLSVTEELNLINFVKGGGRLYAESNVFLRFPTMFMWDTTSYPQDTLWHFLGLRSETLEGAVVEIDTVYGVDSEFTKGMKEPQRVELGGLYVPGWSLIPVLYALSIHFGYQVLAFIPMDTSIRVVLHSPLDMMKFDYYNPFLTRVLCDYFGLCADAVHEAPPSETAINLRAVYDGPRTDLEILSEEASEVDVSNALGVIVFRAPIQAGTSLVELPATLPDGVYFARVQSQSGAKVQSFGIFAR